MSARWVQAVVAWVLAAGLLAACSRSGTPGGTAKSGHKIRIGFSLDTLQEERWQRDRDLFVARARELGAEVIVQAASGDDYLQLSQAENMLARGIDVLVVVPHDAAAMGPIVEKAHQAGVKVVAYDRLITYVNVDFFIAFDSERVGELQAGYLTGLKPKGAYAYFGGSPGDYSTFLQRRGVMTVLEPPIAKGAITLVADEMTAQWSPEAAARLVAAALERSGGQLDGVIAANDAAAGYLIQALYNRGLAGRVLVVGQDADLEALRRVLSGTQTMTVYKPIRQLAARAAEVAVSLAKGQQPVANDQVHNGKQPVPTILLQPVAVDRSNWTETVIRDGFHREQDVLGIR